MARRVRRVRTRVDTSAKTGMLYAAPRRTQPQPTWCQREYSMLHDDLAQPPKAHIPPSFLCLTGPNEGERRAGKEKDRHTHQSGGREKVHAREKGRGKGKEQRSHERDRGLPAAEQGTRAGKGARQAHGEHNTAPKHRRGDHQRDKRKAAPRTTTRTAQTPHTPHTPTAAPTARCQRAPAARPEGGQPGEGEGLTPDAPHNGGRQPPQGRPTATPTARNAGPQGRAPWGRCRVPTPAPTARGTHGSRNPGCPLQRTGGRGRDSA